MCDDVPNVPGPGPADGEAGDRFTGYRGEGLYLRSLRQCLPRGNLSTAYAIQR